MRVRMSTLVTEVERSGVNAMVFGAWGCGSAGLNPHMVAPLFKERLKWSSIPTFFMLLLCMITTALIFTILLARFCVASEVYSVKGQVAGVQHSVWSGPAKWENL